MRTTDAKAIEYLKGNPIVATFIDEVNAKRLKYYTTANMVNQYKELVVEIGNKYIRLWNGTGCWGFISRVDGNLKGAPIKKGDLLKPATWKAPAKHARGNIIDGTAQWGEYGPSYIK